MTLKTQILRSRKNKNEHEPHSLAFRVQPSIKKLVLISNVEFLVSEHFSIGEISGPGKKRSTCIAKLCDVDDGVLGISCAVLQ